MAKVIDRYVVEAGGRFPDWLKDEMRTGRAKALLDEDRNVEKIRLYMASGVKDAFPGNVIMLTQNGMFVMDAASAKKYMGVGK